MFLVPNHKELYKRRQKIFLEKNFFHLKKKFFVIERRRPPPHPAAGRGVFDFILPVPPIRLSLTTVDMCYLILWNLPDFLTF